MELKDTIDLMLSDNHKERLEAETRQLQIRIKKLEDIIYKHDTNKLDFKLNCSVELLRQQLTAMWTYLSLLQQRQVIECYKETEGKEK